MNYISRRDFLAGSALAASGLAVGCASRNTGSEHTVSEQPQTAADGSVHPANRVRSVMRTFASDVEDKSWFNDRDFWRRYLSMLADERFNRFNLALGLGYDFARELRDTYFYFAYPFLLKLSGYDVRATNLSETERDQNLEMLRFISDEATAHGLHFQLGLWTHAYQWIDSPNVNHVIEGLTRDTHAPYCREALTTLLRECPNIAGVTFRIHGESGVAEGSYDFWKAIFDGVVASGRRVEIDMHAKGMDQKMIDLALATGMPVTISPKFWAEHMGLPYHQAAIRPTEVPNKQRGEGLFANSSGSRSFLRYGYGDLLREDRRYGIIHRIWPGTQRVLLWGDPMFASAYSKAMSFCGSDGCEIMEPLSFKGRKGSGLPGGRDGYADTSLRARGDDFEKYRYTYRLWGRMLHDPQTTPQAWRPMLVRDYGDGAADAVEKALGCASRILPLITTAHLPSAANNNYWPEMYVNMPIVGEAPREPYFDTPSPRRFGTVSPLDPQLFSRIDDFATELLTRTISAKYSPAEVARWLEGFADEAAAQLAVAESQTKDKSSAAFRRLFIDTSVQIELGRFFAKKLQAGVLFRLAEQSGSERLLQEAAERYQRARDAWVRIVALTKNAYRDDVSYGIGWFQRGHWVDRLPAIEQDLDAMRRYELRKPDQAGPDTRNEDRLVQEVTVPSRLVILTMSHQPPAAFVRGRALSLEARYAGRYPITGIILHFRHVTHADAWQELPMELNDQGRAFQATIPGSYSDSPYPLQYYFELLPHLKGHRQLHPGLGATLTDQPYYVVHGRQDGHSG